MNPVFSVILIWKNNKNYTAEVLKFSVKVCFMSVKIKIKNKLKIGEAKLYHEKNYLL